MYWEIKKHINDWQPGNFTIGPNRVIQVRKSPLYEFSYYFKKKNVLVKHKVYLSVLQPHPIGDRESKRKEGSLQPDSLISVNPNK